MERGCQKIFVFIENHSKQTEAFDKKIPVEKTRIDINRKYM
jgi:hypothetical protein